MYIILHLNAYVHMLEKNNVTFKKSAQTMRKR